MLLYTATKGDYMDNFKINTFLSLIQRLPVEDVRDLMNKYDNELKKMSIIEANQILNFIEKKVAIVNNWKNDKYLEDIMTYKFIATKVPELNEYTFEEIDNINNSNPTVLIEVFSILDTDEKINLLNNFASRFTSIVIQTIILSLDNKFKKFSIR